MAYHYFKCDGMPDTDLSPVYREEKYMNAAFYTCPTTFFLNPSSHKLLSFLKIFNSQIKEIVASALINPFDSRMDDFIYYISIGTFKPEEDILQLSYLEYF